MSKTISIVIPIYNEEDNIGELYGRLVKVIERLEYEAELIFVDDGSRDRSLQLMAEIHNQDSR